MTAAALLNYPTDTADVTPGHSTRYAVTGASEAILEAADRCERVATVIGECRVLHEERARQVVDLREALGPVKSHPAFRLSNLAAAAVSAYLGSVANDLCGLYVVISDGGRTIVGQVDATDGGDDHVRGIRVVAAGGPGDVPRYIEDYPAVDLFGIYATRIDALEAAGLG